MPETPPSLTPLTQDKPISTGSTRQQIVGRVLVALLIWLAANLVVFVATSFLAFILLNSLGLAQEQEAFTLSILCAIPLALTVSGLLAGRKIYFTLTKREP